MNVNIPIAKPYLTKAEAQAAYDTILSGWITQGPKVQEFETAFAAYTGARYAVAVSNCTTALHLSMIVAGIGPGDEVICPSMSYIATANAVRYVGATPVFAEVRPDDYNLDPADAERRITKNTKAILLVHQMGMPADIDRFQEMCSRHKLQLIEDAACAAGSAYKGKKIGAHSDLVCFSFHPRKVISTGDGGMIATSRQDYYERLKLLRQHGMSVNDRVRHEAKKLILEEHVELGYNYRMTDIQAAVGIEQLKKLDWIVGERKKLAQAYAKLLHTVPYLQLPAERDGVSSNFQSYCVLLQHPSIDRNALMQLLLDQGIATRRGIMCAHLEQAYAMYQLAGKLPLSEQLHHNSILLPLYVPMELAVVESVVRTFKEVTAECLDQSTALSYTV